MDSTATASSHPPVQQHCHAPPITSQGTHGAVTELPPVGSVVLRAREQPPDRTTEGQEERHSWGSSGWWGAWALETTCYPGRPWVPGGTPADNQGQATCSKPSWPHLRKGGRCRVVLGPDEAAGEGAAQHCPSSIAGGCRAPPNTIQAWGPLGERGRKWLPLALLGAEVGVVVPHSPSPCGLLWGLEALPCRATQG